MLNPKLSINDISMLQDEELRKRASFEESLCNVSEDVQQNIKLSVGYGGIRHKLHMKLSSQEIKLYYDRILNMEDISRKCAVLDVVPRFEKDSDWVAWVVLNYNNYKRQFVLMDKDFEAHRKQEELGVHLLVNTRVSEDDIPQVLLRRFRLLKIQPPAYPTCFIATVYNDFLMLFNAYLQTICKYLSVEELMDKIEENNAIHRLLWVGYLCYDLEYKNQELPKI